MKLLQQQNLPHKHKYHTHKTRYNRGRPKKAKSGKVSSIFDCFCLHIIQSKGNDDPFSGHIYLKVKHKMGLAILHFTDLAMVGSWEFYTVAFEAIAQFC